MLKYIYRIFFYCQGGLFLKNIAKKSMVIVLCLTFILSILFPGVTVSASGENIKIYYNDAELTEVLHITEYDSVQLTVYSESEYPEGSYIEWESNMPLLADVDENGKVTAYDYSKAAVINYWLDNDVRTIPIIGNATADAIEKAFADAGIDLNDSDLNTDVVVAIVKGINADLGAALETLLENMTITITARLVSETGDVLASDTAEVAVDQSFAGNLWPTGVHITNKKTVPKIVAVGVQIQLYGAVTPVRLKQGVKWTVGKVIDTESSKHATITSDGLVTFTSPGKVTIRVNPESALYATVSDTIEFTVVSPEELPVEDFTICGNLEVKEGETTQLSVADVIPAGAYTGSVVWESSDPTAAVITQDGLVTALDAGQGISLYKNVDISATIDGVTKTVTLKINKNVIGATITGVEINGYDDVAVNETNKYTADVTPERLNSNSAVIREWGLYHSQTGELIIASSDSPADNGFATIDTDGNLTATGVGIIRIYVKVSYNGTVFEAEKQVSSGVPITSFSLEKGSGFTTNILTGSRDSFLEEGKQASINITEIFPADYDPDLLNNVLWASSDPSVATVDENGNVLGLDSGGLTIYNSKSVTITATIGGVSASITFNVRGASVNNLVNASITGNYYVVKDFPRSYTAIFSPSRINTKDVHWGLSTDDGERPWKAEWSSTSGNTENTYAYVDSDGTVYGKSAGKTNLWVFGREGLTSVSGSYAEASKEITIIELQPNNIAVKAPEKYDYIEGDTELDLTGLEVSAIYNRSDLEQYYPDADSYGDSLISVNVTDYEVSEIDTSLIDKEQYIIITLTRAGHQFRAVFPVKIHSKSVESIDIESPRYQYIEGENELDLTNLHVYANYSNAPREEVFDYTIDDSSINFDLLNEEQTVSVVYEHYGLSASAEFKIIIYGKPVVSVDTGGYNGEWVNNDVSFTLDSTHKLDKVTYYYNVNGGEWQEMTSDTLIITENTDALYYFKAVNSVGIESDSTQAYPVKIDKVMPSFSLVQDITEITNQSYSVQIIDCTVGASGIASVYLNGELIESHTSFTVDENDVYTVKIISNSKLESEQSISIENIDKEKPSVTGISVEHKDTGGFARFINELTFGLFFNKTTELTVTAEDYGIAGIDRIEYRFVSENGNPIGDWAVYDENSRPVQDADFKGYAEARAIDKAGNISEIRLTGGYIIEREAPTDIQITAESGGDVYESDNWTSKDVTIKLSSSAFSGIYRYYYSLNEGEWTELDGDTLTVAEQGIGSYRFKAVSYASNETETADDFIVKLDKTEPVVRVDFEGTFGRWSADGVKFSLSILNEAISGVTYYYSNDGGQVWLPAEQGSTIVVDYDVNASYIFKAVNGAGVESNPSDSYLVMIDTVVPTLEYTLENTENTKTPYNILFNVITGEAGLESVCVNGVDITGTDSFEVSENGKYVFVMTGKNGITSTEVINVSNFIVAERPVLFVTPDGTLGHETTEAVTFTLTSPNGGSDISYYYNDGNGWVQIDGNTLVVSQVGNYSFTFKAVNVEGLESYQSPEYNVIIVPEEYRTVFKTTVLEAIGEEEGKFSLSGVNIYVDGVLIGATDENGILECDLKSGIHTVEFNNGTFNRTEILDVNASLELNVPMVALDINKDGYVNARDYALIRSVEDTSRRELYKSIFVNFINACEKDFVY